MNFKEQIQIQIKFRGVCLTGNKLILKMQILFFTVQ